MIISEIKQRGKGDKYYIYIDGELGGIFDALILVREKLKTGMEIDEDYFNTLKLENGYLTCFDASIKALERTLKTEKTMRNYLKQKEFLPVCIDDAIEKLKDYGYLDDFKYCKAYIETYKNKKGKRLLKLELKSKGVNENTLSEVFEEELSQEEEIVNLSKKIMRNKEITKENLQKLKMKLFSKGFSGDEISFAVVKIKEGEMYEDWN